MIRSLWIAKTGMEAQQTQLDNISHNLANVGTNGFKRSHAVFEDLIYQNLRQSGANTTEQTQLPTGLQLGLGVRTVATSRNFSQGSLQQTTGNFDLAIKGSGFFQIQLPDGTTAYTRDGSFQINDQGQIVTSEGYPLLPNLTVPNGAQSLTVGSDGVVSVTLAGQIAPQQIGNLQIADFLNPAGLQPIGENLFLESGASGAAQLGDPRTNGLGALQQHMLESSNVNVAEELVSMIETQRAYEVNSKAIQTTDQMLQYLNQNV